VSLVTAFVVAFQLSAAGDIDRVVSGAIRDGVFPGAIVVVGTRERTLLARGYGHFTWSAESQVPDPDSTLFDLASLTKVVATTPAAMILVDAGWVQLDAPVQRYLPEFRGEGKGRVTVRHLLEHRSGLRAFLPLNQLAADSAVARRLVLEEPLRWVPGTRVEYSDLNAMLLGWVVEVVTKRPLEEFVAARVFRPLGMTQTMFRPARALRPRIVPVGLWRGHAIAGELHDQNAVRLGGVSGHAGLYSSAADLARYARFYLRGGVTADGERLVTAATLAEFTRRGPGNRALGWEMNDPTSAEHTGTLLQADAFGHGGYTGTSIWIDPQRGLFVVVLTNRVFAPRARRSISRLKVARGEVADAAVALHREVCGAAPAATSTC